MVITGTEKFSLTAAFSSELLFFTKFSWATHDSVPLNVAGSHLRLGGALKDVWILKGFRVAPRGGRWSSPGASEGVWRSPLAAAWIPYP